MDNNIKSLIEVPAELQDLGQIQKTKYTAALTNLVTGKTPTDVIFQRKIRGGAQVDYVPGWWFIEQLNALFGYLWSFDVTEQFIGEKQVWVKGKLTVRVRDNLEVSKTAFGGSDIKKYGEKSDKYGQVIDIADDLKAASTDALKKAATQLGLAADIYSKRETIEQTTASGPQLTALYKAGEQKGMSKEKVDALSVKEHGDTPDKLETVLILGLIGKIRSKVVEEEGVETLLAGEVLAKE